MLQEEYYKKQLSKYLYEASSLYEKLLQDQTLQQQTAEAITRISRCFDSGHKLLIAGNGGSAADSQHFAAEFTGRYKQDRVPLPAITLSAETSTLTGVGNDYGYNQVFARQIEAFGNLGDIFIAFSTSGNSENISQALIAAKAKGLKTICLLGKGGGAAKELADISIVIPSNNTPRIQEAQTLLFHSIAEEVENRLAPLLQSRRERPHR